MGSESPKRESSRRHERSDRDRERDRERPRDDDKDKSKGRDKDRDSERRRDRHRDYDEDRRSRHGDSHRRDRDGRRDDKERSERSSRDDRKDDDSTRSRARSRDSKRKRRDDSEDRGERSERRRRDHRDDDRRDRRDRGRGDRKKEKEKKKEPAKLGGPLPDQAAEFAMAEGGEPPPPPKEKPNWGSTGALAAESNAVSQADGSVIVLKYSEPPNARKPSPRDKWSMFVFKDGDIVDTVDLSARSCWLVGREDKVVDIVAAHPSISGQHAVVQFRHIEKRNEFGDRISRVKPYIIDLASANGTSLNGDVLDTQRYVELRHKDMVKFGHSAREYVIMLAPRD